MRVDPGEKAKRKGSLFQSEGSTTEKARFYLVDVLAKWTMSIPDIADRAMSRKTQGRAAEFAEVNR